MQNFHKERDDYSDPPLNASADPYFRVIYRVESLHQKFAATYEISHKP